MPKTEIQIEDLRERLTRLRADCDSEIAAVIAFLEAQENKGPDREEIEQALRNQSHDLTELRQRVHDRDLALDYIKKKSKEKDARITDLEMELARARAQATESARQADESEMPVRQKEIDQQAELEAMRAELAARKSLIKSLRSDAERARTLANELAESRQIIDETRNQKKALEKKSNDWERMYRQLAREKSEASASNGESDPAETSTDRSAEEIPEVDGTRTIVIDMTEPLRAARDVRRSGRKK